MGASPLHKSTSLSKENQETLDIMAGERIELDRVTVEEEARARSLCTSCFLTTITNRTLVLLLVLHPHTLTSDTSRPLRTRITTRNNDSRASCQSSRHLGRGRSASLTTACSCTSARHGSSWKRWKRIVFVRLHVRVRGMLLCS